MNVTYLIGNGFDVNLGLSTKYTDYYDEYRNTFLKMDLSPNSEVIRGFWSGLDNNYADWADFEYALAKHLEGNETTVKAILSDFTIKFSQYLKRITQSADCTDDVVEYFIDFLMNGYTHLVRRDKPIVEPYRIGTRNDFVINFVNLNYTDSVERIIRRYKTKHQSLIINKFNANNTQYSARLVEKVIHPHGSLENGDCVIIGIDSLEQFKSELLKNNIEAEKYCVKRMMNIKGGYEDREKSFETIIEKSDIIYTYGISFGITDKSRWKVITDWLVESEKHILVAYVYDTGFANHTNAYLPNLLDFIDGHKINIMRRIGINDSEFDKYMNQIFVINSGDVLNCKFTKLESTPENLVKN